MRRPLVLLLAFPVLAFSLPAQTRPAAPAVLPDSARFAGLQWRSVGPWRGGRVTTVTGVRGQPLVYYMGATGGGVWKTDDAGMSWQPITDGQLKMGSIGAIAVAPSDPNVLFVGAGEAPIRGVSSSWGDGVYRSTDAGKTWTQSGLADSRQISKVLIHPGNPDVVYVAAQGSRWGRSAERGVYGSRDGGRNWKLLLAGADSLTGPSDLAMDPSNPRVLYAAMWDHQRTPWKVRSGGPGSGIWKSTDGGDTWSRLSGGLPKLMGKIGIAVSPANPDRPWAIIEAEDGGLYKSEDAGVVPGTYQARMSYRGQTVMRFLTILPDPRGALSAETARGQQELLSRVYGRLDEVHAATRRLRTVREQVQGLLDRTKDHAAADTLGKAGRALIARIDSLDGQLVNVKNKTFQDVVNFPPGINAQFLTLAQAIDGSDAPVTEGMRTRLADLEVLWAPLKARAERMPSREVGEFNALVREKNIPAIVVP